ncbi:MAG TPA: hypothetical protein VHY56_09755, partial [Candidatus Binataceae bacterium]|nr:hypothetical protein [Candidatus Binataceae bacterium]
MAATALLCALSAAVVLAGEVSNSTDSLNVMGATAGVLPQASSSTAESSLLAGLHISGYAS